MADDTAVAELVQRAAASWPGLALDPARLATYLAERAIAPTPDLRIDLALACACLDGSAIALQTFEREILQPVVARFARSSGRGVADDLASRLRELLFVGLRGVPRLASYQGRGDLRGWLEVVATREAHKLAGRELPVANDDAILAALPGDDDLELREIKAQHRAELALAFREALAAVEPRTRLVLRQRYLDALTFDEVAALHGVHRLTVMRWMARIENELLRDVQRRLAERLRLAHSEVAQLVDDARSGLDVSLRGLLVTRSPA